MRCYGIYAVWRKVCKAVAGQFKHYLRCPTAVESIMKLRAFAYLAVVVVLGHTSVALAAPITVNGLGEHGWVSGDTRPPAGGPASPAQIAAQIKFLGEGQNVADAAGGLPGNSPAGSLNGAGYVRLDGTNQNAGKSDISTFGNFGPASALLSNSFSFSFSYYNDSNPTQRTLGMNIELSNGNIFAYLNPSHNFDAWNTASIDQNTDAFRLYGPGGPGAAETRSLAEWAADPAWAHLFTSGLDITRIGFNLGSSQRSNLAYLDWAQTNLLNGGDLIDFQDAELAEVPEPASLAVWSLMGVAGLAYRWRRKKPNAGESQA